MRLATVDFCSYNESVAAAFDKIDAGNTLEKQSAILIKPNLTNSSPPVKKIIAGFTPLEVDRQAAKLLGLDWKRIPHLAQVSQPAS